MAYVLMWRMASVLILLWTLFILAGCTQNLQGPEIDPIALTTPTPVAAPAPPRSPQPPQAPPTTAGQFAAWEPRQCLPAGECAEGHWLTIPLTAPRLEVLDPARPIPRAPRLPLPSKKTTQTAPTQPQPTPEPVRPMVPPSYQPQMTLPPGLGMEQVQEQLRPYLQGGR